MAMMLRLLLVVAVALVVGARFLYENCEAMGKIDAPATNECLRVVNSFDDLSFPASQELGWPFVTKAYTPYILLVLSNVGCMELRERDGLTAEFSEPTVYYDRELLSRPQFAILN